jgi:OTU domain-containing protein 6
VKDQVKRLGKKGKEEGAKLLKEMEERHESELAALEERSGERQANGSSADAATESMSNLSFYGRADASNGNNAGDTVKKSKAQKRRERLEQEELERERRIAEELENMGETDKLLEETALLSKLSSEGLAMKDIPSDGNCLYRAIEDQIKNQLPVDVKSRVAEILKKDVEDGSKDGSKDGIEDTAWSYGALRRLCAAHLLQNQEAYIHFVEVEDEEGYRAYCDEVERTAAWGGHVELQALSHALGLHVRVHSADGPCVEVGPEHADTVNVCYLKHSCALGEHYNSCATAATTTVEV